MGIDNWFLTLWQLPKENMKGLSMLVISSMLNECITYDSTSLNLALYLRNVMSPSAAQPFANV